MSKDLLSKEDINGPWTCTESPLTAGYYYVRDAHHRNVVMGPSIASKERAMLIAAAPDLLDCLRQFVAQFGSTNELSMKARAVIRRIDGEL